jgi:hypothetical protein
MGRCVRSSGVAMVGVSERSSGRRSLRKSRNMNLARGSRVGSGCFFEPFVRPLSSFFPLFEKRGRLFVLRYLRRRSQGFPFTHTTQPPTIVPGATCLRLGRSPALVLRATSSPAESLFAPNSLSPPPRPRRQVWFLSSLGLVCRPRLASFSSSPCRLRRQTAPWVVKGLSRPPTCSKLAGVATRSAR